MTSKQVAASPLYDRMRDDILSLAIAPGADLEETVLATDYGVSRTPIRETLIRLAADGLIEFKPKRGARVIPIILPNLPRYLETLDLIQRALARVAAVRHLPRDTARLAEAIDAYAEAGRIIDMRTYQTVIHAAAAEGVVFGAVAEGAHNFYMIEIFEKLHLQGQRMLRLSLAYRPAGTESVADYVATRIAGFRALADAIAEGDGPRSEDAIRGLHTAMTTRLSAYLTENLAGDVSLDVEPGPATPR